MKKLIFKNRNKKVIAFKRKKQSELISYLITEMRIQMSI